MKPNYQANKACFLSFMLAFTIISSNIQAQKTLTLDQIRRRERFNLYIIPGVSMFVSGALDGTIESISYHYQDGFKRVFSNANDQYWNPAISWTNKYKNNDPSAGPKFPGSTSVLVFTTDAYHGLRATRNMVDAFTLSFYIDHSCRNASKLTFKKLFINTLLLAAIRDLGFFVTYSCIFNESGHS